MYCTMVIGIDASRACLRHRTGIEEYAYQIIRHARAYIPDTDRVILYVRAKRRFVRGRLMTEVPTLDFSLPHHWEIRGIWAPRFWTQISLSWEMWRRAPDVLFIPAHTIPFIHPRKTIVTIHGLEYEFCPEGYSHWARWYMRFSIRFSCRAAKTIICVSHNTKRDVMRLYAVPTDKIVVVAEGYGRPPSQKTKVLATDHTPYILFIGRLEARKNIVRLIQAFSLLKKKFAIPHTLVLIGKSGYGYADILTAHQADFFGAFIQELGYVTETEKWHWLAHADIFAFPTLYEGFGIPVLEAQSMGVPVVTAYRASLPEVAAEGAVYVNPESVESIADGLWRVISEKTVRDGIIDKGQINRMRFSWAMSAQEVVRILDCEK
ncbi:MAG: glycosyltransferase family 4 protein [Minisyncoccota bacterium]